MSERRPSEPRAGELHELLPWYVNGTLPAAEAEAFRQHLRGCDACRNEMEFIERLQTELERHGEAFLDDHPSAEDLVAFDRGELGEDAARNLRRHLALCATCTAEMTWITGKAVASSAPDPARPAAGHRAWLPWAAAVAAGIAGFLLAIPFLDSGRDPLQGGAPPVRVLPATERSGTEPHRVEIAAGHDGFLLMAEIDFPVSAFPIRFAIVNSAGRAVRSGAITADVPRDGLAFIDCKRADFPDGLYRLQVQPVGLPATETAFRIVTPPLP